MMMIGVAGNLARKACMKSRPEAPGMRISLITTCGVSSSSASASRPSCADTNDL